MVTCGHEVSHGTGITESREIPTDVEVVLFLGTRGSQVDHIWYPGRSGYALAKAFAEVESLGGSKLNLKETGWETNGTSWLVDGGEVASGMECAVISGARLMPNKSPARVLASLVRLGLARCWEATPVVVSGARITPDMSPAGVSASSTRSSPTADEGPPLAWPWLLRLPLLRRGGWRGKPGCSSSATGGSRRRVCLRRASR
jgi:hypothetical protein